MRLLLVGTACALVHNRTREGPHPQALIGLERPTPSPPEQIPLVEEGPAPKDFAALLLGLIALSFAISVHWFNEERSAKTEVLLTKGLEDCESVDANHVDAENRGRLIHVQGKARGMVPIADHQFQDAVVFDCIKLQSTLEVLQSAGKDKALRGLEWSTSHRPNLRPPSGLALGTQTTLCPRVTLGSFSLSQEMLVHFRSYESASMPDVVHAAGIPFYAGQDGFFYGRPGSHDLDAKAFIANKKEVGDLRVRFLCIKNCDATVVAVQCHKEFQEFDTETFLPYRMVPRALCEGERQERLKIVEAGERSLRDLREASCCTGGVATCCCCPCNTIACVTSNETVTEEIFFVSDSLEAKEKPFDRAVCRSPWRLWNWRAVGWALTYLSLHWMLLPFLPDSAFKGLSGWGRSAPAVLLLTITLEVWGFAVAAAYAFYRPSMGMKYLAAVTIFCGVPFICSQLLH